MKDRPLPPERPELVGLGQNSVDHLVRLERLPRPGEKLEALGHRMVPGGQVATAMLAGQRMGLRCAYIGAVGDDQEGGYARKALEQYGVDVYLRQVQGARTRMATVLVTSDGERVIIEHQDPGVRMRPRDLGIYRELICGARALHLDITGISAAVTAARWAREAGVMVSLDIDRYPDGVEELLPLVDLVLGSEGLPAEIGCEGPQEALARLGELCPGVVGVTLGEDGCLLREPGAAAPTRVPGFLVEAADTTGCGDVFRGAMVAALLTEAGSFIEAARFGAAAAALQARREGALPAVPSLEEVQTFLANDPPVRDM